MKPTVGRIVHYYTDNGASHNGVGCGPYAAIITQVFGEGVDAYANLKVLPPFAESFDSGSVRHKDFDGDSGRYWEWPPRDEKAA